MNFIFFVFNTLKALSYGFLLLVVVSTFLFMFLRRLQGGFEEKLKGDFISSFLTPLKRLRVAFSFLWGVEHVFVHFFTA